MLPTGATLAAAEAARTTALARALGPLRTIPLGAPCALRAISFGAAGAFGPVAIRTAGAIMPRAVLPALPIRAATLGPPRMDRTIPSEPACALTTRTLGTLAALGELYRLMLGTRLAGATIALHPLRRTFGPVAGSGRMLIPSITLFTRPATATLTRPPRIPRAITRVAGTPASTGSPAVVARRQHLLRWKRQA